MTDIPKPEVEQLKRFYLLDRISSNHLNYLREKSIVVDYQEGDYLYKAKRSSSMGFYLLNGLVEVEDNGEIFVIEAGSEESYHSLEEKRSKTAAAKALCPCTILQLSRVLVEQYCSWSTTGQYQVVDIADLEAAGSAAKLNWMGRLLNSVLARNLSSADAEQVLSLFKESRVRQHDIVLKNGEGVECFYVIKHGEARLVDQSGRESDLNIGDFFGEEFLVSHSVSSVEVTMKTPGLIAILEKPHFEKMLKRSFIRYVSENHLLSLNEEKYRVLDVRLFAEYKIGHRQESINIPLNSLPKKSKELSKSLMYLISPECGIRGELAVYMLQQEGLRAYMLGSSGESMLSESELSEILSQGEAKELSVRG